MKKVNTPTIKTDRLILRKFSDSDLQDMYEIYHDKEVNKFLPWYPFQSIEETKEYLYNDIYKKYKQKIAYQYAIEEKASHKVIGYIAVSDINEERESAELGYGLLKDYWGIGIATEASKALLERLKKDGFGSIIATNDVNNIGSGKVLEKSGMTYQYSYDELWQPKNISVTFRLHRIDFWGRERAMCEKMHVDELEIDEQLVRRLLIDQFPHWAGLLLRRVEPVGTVNAIFRLGDKYSVRLARREGPTKPGSREHTWLPKLASLVPFEIPVPIAQGHPNDEYPWYWDVHKWLQGETMQMEAIDEIQAARDLAAFVAALQQVDSSGGPVGRGIPLSELDENFQNWLSQFDGDSRVSTVWESALAAPPWNGSPVWHHGDLDVRNWLVRDNRISGVIDWGDTMGIGDPACDVMVAWKLHSPAARDAFRRALPTDDATWARARGWVVSQAVAILAYYTPQNNPMLYNEAKAWLDLVLSEN